MFAIMELRKIDRHQQIKDADNWLNVGSMKEILTKGVEGLNIDNPGNFTSPMLN